jgi:hypothetical protein
MQLRMKSYCPRFLNLRSANVLPLARNFYYLTEQTQACRMLVLRRIWNEVLRMRSECSHKRNTTAPTCLFPYLFVRVCQSVVSVVVSSWFSVLRIIPICRKFSRNVLGRDRPLLVPYYC